MIGSVITGHLFVVYALLPDTATIKITSPPKGQAIPVGNLTIWGISSDNVTTDCHVYAGWNDLKPYHTVVANGASGADDYSKWAFTYTNRYHPITNGTNKLTAKISCDDNTGSLAKWYSVNVTGVLPVAVAASSSQSTTNTTKLFAAIQGQQNSTDKLQEAVFRSLHVQVPTISEINKISIVSQQQQNPGIKPQELQNALKISLDNLSTKQKSMLTQPQVDLLKTMSPLIQKGLSPQQGTQFALLIKQLTKGAMGPSYNIFDPVSGTVNLGIKLVGLIDSGKIKSDDFLIGAGAIILSSQTGLSPDFIYEGGKYLFSRLPGPTTQVSTITPQKQTHPITTTDFGPHPSVQDDKNKKDLVVVPIKDCYDDTGKNSYCVKIDSKRNVGFCDDDDIDCVGVDYVLPSKDATGKWYYPPNALEKAQKDAADKARKDAGADTQRLNGHGYDSSCPSGHSAGYCGSYRQAYDIGWKDLHPSVPTPSDTGSPIPFLQPSAPPQPQKTEFTPIATDEARKDAGADTQRLNGHGYDSSCPSGHSAGYCGSYRQAYDNVWKDLHPSSPVATSNALTAEKPTTTAEQPIPTPDKSFQSGVQQQLSVPQKSEPSGQEIAGTPSVNSPTTTNPQATDNELNQQGLGGSNTPSTNPPITSKQDTGTALSSGDPNSVVNNPQPLSTTPDQSVSGVQPGQGGGSAVVAPDKGQTTTTGQDQGTSGSGSTDGSSGGNSLAPDTTTQSPDNTPTTRSTVPDQSVSGVQPEQGGGSAVLVPDKGQTATTSQDQGTSGSGGSDDNSGSSGSTSGDSSITPRDNSPPSDSSSTVDRHSSGDGDSSSGKHRHSSNSGDSSSSGDDG